MHVIKMLIKHEEKPSALLHWGSMPCPLYILLAMLTRCLTGPLDLFGSIVDGSWTYSYSKINSCFSTSHPIPNPILLVFISELLEGEIPPRSLDSSLKC